MESYIKSLGIQGYSVSLCPVLSLWDRDRQTNTTDTDRQTNNWRGQTDRLTQLAGTDKPTQPARTDRPKTDTDRQTNNWRGQTDRPTNQYLGPIPCPERRGRHHQYKTRHHDLPATRCEESQYHAPARPHVSTCTLSTQDTICGWAWVCPRVWVLIYSHRTMHLRGRM